MSEGTLQHIHLFVSRDKVFDKESVLQETIIIKVRKSTQKPSKVAITTTQSNNDFSNITTFEAPYTTVISVITIIESGVKQYIQAVNYAL